MPVELWDKGNLNLSEVILYQAQHGWLILYAPLSFVIFLVAAFAETNRLPFDLPESETELVGGYHTEYSSMRFGLFFMGESLVFSEERLRDQTEIVVRMLLPDEAERTQTGPSIPGGVDT